MMRRLPLLMAALSFVDFIDDLSSGIPMSGIPGIETSVGLTYTTAAFLVAIGFSRVASPEAQASRMG